MKKEKTISYVPIEEMTVKNLRKVIKNFKPDLIHAHDYTTSVIAALSFTKIPIISHLHNNSPWIKKLGIKSMVYAMSCFRYKKILAVSSSVIEENRFIRNFLNKIHIIGNPVNVEIIKKEALSIKIKDKNVKRCN